MTEPVPPLGLPDVPYVSEADLSAAVHAASASSPALLAACWAATETVTVYCGQVFAEPIPEGVHLASLQLAVRFYTASDVARGTYTTDLGTGFTGRWVTPEIEALLLGKRVSFGVA